MLVRVRLKQIEKRALDKLAEERGMSRGNVLRDLLQKARVKIAEEMLLTLT